MCYYLVLFFIFLFFFYYFNFFFFFFFFLQAEDGIRDPKRDWSSDVCSSDLAAVTPGRPGVGAHGAIQRRDIRPRVRRAPPLGLHLAVALAAARRRGQGDRIAADLER